MLGMHRKWRRMMHCRLYMADRDSDTDSDDSDDSDDAPTGTDSDDPDAAREAGFGPWAACLDSPSRAQAGCGPWNGLHHLTDVRQAAGSGVPPGYGGLPPAPRPGGGGWGGAGRGEVGWNRDGAGESRMAGSGCGCMRLLHSC